MTSARSVLFLISVSAAIVGGGCSAAEDRSAPTTTTPLACAPLAELSRLVAEGSAAPTFEARLAALEQTGPRILALLDEVASQVPAELADEIATFRRWFVDTLEVAPTVADEAELRTLTADRPGVPEAADAIAAFSDTRCGVPFLF